MNEQEKIEQIDPVQEPAPREEPFWNYRDLALVLGAGLPLLAVAAFLVRGLFIAFSWSGRGTAMELLPAQFLAYIFWFGFLFLLLRMKYDRPLFASLGWIRAGEPFWKFVRAGVALAFGIALAGVLLRTPDIDMPMKQLLTTRTSVLLIGIAAVSFGPFCEELAFRGFVQPLLVRSLGAPAGIALAALPFAFLHGPQYGWSWRHMLLIAVAGASFGWMRHRTGSTLASAVMHAAYNFTFFAIFIIYGKDLPTEW